MDDLRIFRALQEGRAAPADVAELVAELAAKQAQVGAKAPFLGFLLGLFERGERRAEVLRFLHGCAGVEAICAAEGALGDAEGEVAGAALGFFKKLAESQPQRWVHVAFHPEARVRLEALGEGVPQGAASMGFALLADEACREAALARFCGEGPRWVVPASSLGTLLSLTEQGLLSREQARGLLASMSPEAVKPLLDQGKRRSDAVIKGWLEAASRLAEAPRVVEGEPGPGEVRDEPDELDRLLDLLWEMDGGIERDRRDFFERLASWQLSLPADELPRVAAALVRKLAIEKKASPLVMEMLVEVHPAALGFAWIERASRREGLRVFFRRGPGSRKLGNQEVEALVESDLSMHPEGGLDLWALAGVMSLLAGTPIAALLDWVSVGRVLEAFGRRADESSPLLSLPDASARGTAYLLDQLRLAMPEQARQLSALWALTAPVDQLTALGFRPSEEKSRKEKKALERRAKRSGKAEDAEAARKASESKPPGPISAEEAIDIYKKLQATSQQGRAIERERVDKLASVLGERILASREGFSLFLREWLGPSPGEPPALGMQFFVYFAGSMDAEAFAGRCAELPAERLLPLLDALSFCTTFPFARERVMAGELVRHKNARVREWALKRLPAEEQKAPPVSTEGKPLSDGQVDEVATVAEAQLARVVKDLGVRRTRVTEALARRPAGPSQAALVALLGCEDPVAEVDREFARFCGEGEAFYNQLLGMAVERLNGSATLPLLGHAWMMLWERHSFALVDRLVSEGGTITGGLLPYLTVIKAPRARAQLLGAVANAVGLLSYRDRERLAAVCTPELLDVFAREILGPAGFGAAEALVFCHRNLRTGPLAERLASLRPAVAAMLPDLPMNVRERLTPWVSSEGLPPPVERAVEEAKAPFELASVQQSTDLDQLEAWCATAPLSVVEEVALRLSELGEAGRLRCARVLGGAAERRRAEALSVLVELWPEGEALAAVRSLVAGDGPGDVRFVAALALLRRRDPGALDGAVRAACAALPVNWFTSDDFRQLRLWAPGLGGLCRALAASPQPHAYREAVEWLLAADDESLRGDVEAGLLAFLEAGSVRLRSLRTRAAQRLHRAGAWQALPVLLQDMVQGAADTPDLLKNADEGLCSAVVRSLLLTGELAHEQIALKLLHHAPEAARSAALQEVIDRCLDDDVRRGAVRLVREQPYRAWKLATLGETFAWGVIKGRELLGGLYQVEMIEGNELGYTRLNEHRIFVSPLPILRRERRGRELVEGLILHELGHHRYHKGDLADACWKTSHKERIQGLFNLVLDEHLERNLRAIDDDSGDRLKLLAAYAFQHATRTVGVEALLSMTGWRAAAVLPKSRLRVARDPDSVVVESGVVLQAMEREGMSFSRFMRAMRMGLGNRHGDPKVARGLALFKGGFRNKSASELLEVARELKRIFGHETCALECFGSHESLVGDKAEAIGNGDAISAEEVAEEVERVLNPKKGPSRGSSDEEGPKKLWININPDEQFDKITSVIKIGYVQEKAEKLAREVRRQAFHLRRYLEDLGMARVPERRRMQGHRFDATRAQAMVLRNDPRVLIARRLEQRADVYLGIVVDCSGSMACGGRIERARLFAALIAEAVRGLKGVEAHVIGFTDQVIYDAGSAEQCSAHGLEAGGGNNDAAALWFAALRALRSRRRSKVLVMISDGLPTECSVAALRGLVGKLSRQHVICAQVAVAPITEACFPHHVLLDDSNTADAVRRFGALVGNLVRRSMAS